MKGFKREILRNGGHVAGLVTDGGTFPERSVQDCMNMDFYERHDERRMPYISEGSVPTGSGYNVNALFEKSFTDASGGERRVVVATAIHSSPSSSNPMRVYVNKWFDPSYDYGNSALDTNGWLNKWVELTEKVTFAKVSGDIATQTGNIISNIDATTLGTNYFKGWYLYDEVMDTLLGLVTFSSNDAEAVLYVSMATYINSNALTLRGVVGAGNFTLVRFPVTAKNKGAFAVIKETGIVEGVNSVKITCGHEGEVLNLSFLQEKKFFGTAGNIGAGSNEWKRDWNGFWFGYDVPEIRNKSEAIHGRHYHTSYTGGETNITTTYYEGDYEKIGMMLKVTSVRYFDAEGWHFHKTLGITNLGSKNNVEAWFYGVGAELDGYQLMLLKFLMGTISAYTELTSFGTPISKAFGTKLKVELLFGVDFDRRLSGIGAFFRSYYPAEPVQTGTADNNLKIDEFIAYDESELGVTNIVEESAIVREIYECDEGDVNGSYKINTDHAVVSGHNMYERVLFDTNIRNEKAVGLSLNAALNNYFWKDVHTKVKELVKVGDDYLGINLSNDSVSSEDEHDKNGQMKVVMSQIQRGFVSAGSMFPDERVRQLTTGGEIVKAVWSYGNQVLIFTGENLTIYEVAGNKMVVLRKEKEYSNIGLWNRNAAVRCQIGNQFAGIYWVSTNGSVYRFLYDKPEDIMENRIRDWFQENITDANRLISVAGYNPRTGDVYFVFNSTTMLVWNVRYEHWKKYKYNDVPRSFYVGEDLYFGSGSGIYRVSRREEIANFLDKSVTGIDFMMKRRINMNAPVVGKIADRIEWKGEFILGDAESNYRVDVQAGSGSSSHNLLDVRTHVTANTSFNRQVKKRVRAGEFNVKLSSVDHANIQRFKLMEWVVGVIIGGRKMNKSVGS